MLSHLFVIYCIALAAVVAKLTVADLIAKTYGRSYCHIIMADDVTTFNPFACIASEDVQMLKPHSI